MKKVLVGLFLAVFGVAMANVTLANHENVMCTMQYAPVCGTDGKTYGNSCVAGAAHAEVAYEGECREDVACTKEYQPVCGYVQVQCIQAPCYPQPQTFGNRCEAEAANATNISEGACTPNARYNVLENTSWKLTTFDGSAVVGEHTLSFTDTKVSAKVCNHKSGSYEVMNDTIIVGENMISTLMFCTGPAGEYEAHFDLSGANFELATDGANHLMITTAGGHTYQRTSVEKNPSKPVSSTNRRRYGLIIRQLNQIAKIRGFDTVIEKQAMAQGLLDKINEIMMVSLMTPTQNAKWVFLKNAVQYYYDHIGDGTFTSL